MASMSSDGHSLDGSFPVLLKALDSEAMDDLDLEFPRLVDLQYEVEDSSKILIKLLNGPHGTSFLEVGGSDTVAEVKRRAILHAKVRELAKLAFAGMVLEDEQQTLVECGIVSGAEISVLWPEGADEIEAEQHDLDVEDGGALTQSESTGELAPRGGGIALEVERRDLMNKARARILYQWDGFTLDRQMLGLPLRPNDFVMIGRIVNQDWYEGYLPGDKKYGYIPRNYVKIESVYEPSFGETLGCYPQELPLSAPVSGRPPRRRLQFFWAAFVDPLAGLFSRKTPKQKQKITATGNTVPYTSTPRIPSSPFPPKPPVPSMDILEHGSRLRLSLKLESHNPNDYPTIRANLSLVSAPQTRISHVTVELQFEHDVIVELEPKREESSETEVCHGNSVTNDISLAGGANQGPVGVNLKLGHTVSKAAEFTRRTRGTIIGDGEGSSIAYWVLKEDPGKAGRLGLDPQHTMWVKLHVRPVRVDYQVTAKMVADDGETGNWFSTKRLSSGRQRYYFKS